MESYYDHGILIKFVTGKQVSALNASGLGLDALLDIEASGICQTEMNLIRVILMKNAKVITEVQV